VVDGNKVMSLTFALNIRTFEKLRDKLFSVSDPRQVAPSVARRDFTAASTPHLPIPRSPEYAKYPTDDEIMALGGVRPQDVLLVVGWLQRSGLSNDQVGRQAHLENLRARRVTVLR
jgi:hypothetical protein